MSKSAMMWLGVLLAFVSDLFLIPGGWHHWVMINWACPIVFVLGLVIYLAGFRERN
jgi:hypothetical protein